MNCIKNKIQIHTNSIDYASDYAKKMTGVEEVIVVSNRETGINKFYYEMKYYHAQFSDRGMNPLIAVYTITNGKVTIVNHTKKEEYVNELKATYKNDSKIFDKVYQKLDSDNIFAQY